MDDDVKKAVDKITHTNLYIITSPIWPPMNLFGLEIHWCPYTELSPKMFLIPKKYVLIFFKKYIFSLLFLFLPFSFYKKSSLSVLEAKENKY